MRDADEGDVVVEPAVGAALEVVEPERVLELAVVMFDPLAQLVQPDQILKAGVLGHVGEPVLDRLLLAVRPLTNQPNEGELFAVFMCLGVATRCSRVSLAW